MTVCNNGGTETASGVFRVGLTDVSNGIAFCMIQDQDFRCVGCRRGEEIIYQSERCAISEIRKDNNGNLILSLRKFDEHGRPAWAKDETFIPYDDFEQGKHGVGHIITYVVNDETRRGQVSKLSPGKGGHDVLVLRVDKDGKQVHEVAEVPFNAELFAALPRHTAKK